MKKIALLFSVVALVSETKAQSFDQLTLSGTSYSQNFNTLSAGRPIGWHVFTAASTTSLGRTWDTSATKLLLTPSAGGSTRTNWNGTTGNFRNAASANNNVSTLDSLGQQNYADRALAVRQVGATNSTFPNSDSGAAFALKIENTMHKGAFSLTFKLQSLDATSPRVTTWLVDYGIGATPTTFTPVPATGTMTTGGSMFSNNTITVDFGTALDSISTPVWIRIAAPGPLAGTSGTGNRATTGIDDVMLTYVNNGPTSVRNVYANTPLSLYVIGTATTGNISLGGFAENGKYSVSIYDMSGRIIYANSVNTTGNSSLNISNANLASGLYMVKVSNGKQTGIVKVNVQ